MIRFLFPLLALVALAPETPAQDRRPVRLFAEAEDFTVKSPGWQVVPYRENYFAGTFARLVLQMPKAFTARQMPMVSKASAVRSNSCFMISPRFCRSAVARA